MGRSLHDESLRPTPSQGQAREQGADRDPRIDTYVKEHAVPRK